MNGFTRDGGITEAVDTCGWADRPIRVERFDPGPQRAAAAVLLLHGADGLHHRGASYRDTARDFARDGYLGLLVHYFDSTGNVAASPPHFLRWMEAVEDAVEYAGQQPDLGGRRVGLVGFSLGAYLALAVASQDPRVGVVVSCSGGLPDLPGASLGAMPPVLILHGSDDPVVPVEEALQLERVLKAGGLPYEMQVFPGQGHGLRGAEAAEAFLRALAFLDRHLKPPGPAAPRLQDRPAEEGVPRLEHAGRSEKRGAR